MNTRIGTPLKDINLQSSYDTIVIGSGIGGLTTAALLSQQGQKVLVLERHYTAGGFTHMFERKGYEWDVGIHYVGEVHYPHTVMSRLFSHITEGKLRWQAMEEIFDQIHLGSEVYDFPAGREPFTKFLLGRFPEEHVAIKRYIALIRHVTRNASMYYMQKALPPILAPFAGLMSREFKKYARQTTTEVLRGLTDNEELIGVLCGQWGDYGLPPGEASFAMHAVVVKHYMGGGAYPVGGSSNIARYIEPVITRQGGAVVTSAVVDEIVVEGSRAVAVRLAKGQTIAAKRVVSSAGVRNTFLRLLPEAHRDKIPFITDLKGIKPAVGHLGVYIGIEGDSQDLGLNTTNLWLYNDHRHDHHWQRFISSQPSDRVDFPLVYISFPSAKDPEWQRNHPGRSTIEIIAPVPFSWFAQWQNRPFRKRGPEYKAFKEGLKDQLLEYLYQQRPQLRGKVSYAEISTPLSTKHFSGYQHGEIYGLDHGPERFEKKWLRCHTPIKNLFLTGQDVVSCGVGGAMVAGVLTTMAMVSPAQKWSLLKLLKPQRRQQPENATLHENPSLGVHCKTPDIS